MTLWFLEKIRVEHEALGGMVEERQTTLIVFCK
jgi:hypothetical protein